MKQILAYLWRSIKGYRHYYLMMILAPVITSFYKPVIFYAIKLIIDIISKPVPFTLYELIKPISIYLVADFLSSFIWRGSEVASWRSQPYVKRGIVLSVVDQVLSFRFSFFQNASTGAITSKVKGVLDGYTELWAQLYYGISFWILTVITAIGGIFLVNHTLGIILIIWSLLYTLINYFITIQINRLSQEYNLAKHEVMGKVSDQIGNIQSIKLFASRKFEIDYLHNNISQGYIPKEIKFSKFYLVSGMINDILSTAVVLVVLAIMITLRMHNKISIGDFVFVIGMIIQFQDNLWHLMQAFHYFSDKAGDFKSSLDVYNADVSEDLTPVTSINPDKLYQIEYRNIDFNFNTKRKVFSKFNLLIRPGEKVGIVGHTGSGKSTLINLLLRVFSPNSGGIYINNQAIADIESESLRQLISVVPQDLSLFHRNIMENIRYAKANASDEEVFNACKIANADEFIEKLPHKYQTMVGERGVKLSGGQRQRIAIARAVLKDSPILVFDEATSALDSITEANIQKALHTLFANKTVIVIAHRLSTLKKLDRIIVLDHGVIIEEGTHEELIAKPDGQYYKVWLSQTN